MSSEPRPRRLSHSGALSVLLARGITGARIGPSPTTATAPAHQDRDRNLRGIEAYFGAIASSLSTRFRALEPSMPAVPEAKASISLPRTSTASRQV